MKGGPDEEEMEYEPDELNRQLEVRSVTALYHSLYFANSVDNLTAPHPSHQNNVPKGEDDAAEEDQEDELALQLGPSTYELPPPKPLDLPQTNAFLKATMQRLTTIGSTLSSSSTATAGATDGSLINKGPPPSEMWMLLFIRMITRAQTSSEGPPVTRTKEEPVDADGLEQSEVTVDIKGKGRSKEEVWERNELLRGTVLDYVLVDFPTR